MLSKGHTEKPYYSNKPLSKDSTWIAFPVEIKVKDKEYGTGLAKGKEVISELEKIVIELAENQCEIGNPIMNSGDSTLETLLEFKKISSDSISKISHPIVIRFFENTEFWSKMEIVTKFLDTISEFCNQFEKDKFIDVNLRAGFSGENKFI